MFPVRKLLLGNQSSASLLETCTSVKQAFQIHAQIILNGLHNHIFTLSRLISFFALLDSAALAHSRLIFSSIDRPNLFIWNTMIRGYSRSESPLDSVVLYKSMLAQDLAQQLFDESCDRDLVSFNTMINGYARGGRPINALNLFAEMLVPGIRPDEFTIVALLSACSMLNDPKTGQQIHLLMYKNSGFDDSNLLLRSSLVDMYAKCGWMKMADRVFHTTGTSKSAMAWSSMVSGYAKSGEIEIARQLFDEMPERDIVSWTAMMSAYSQSGHYNEALKLFAEMERLGVIPDEVTMVTVLSACAQLGALDFGKKLLQYIKGRSFDQNVILSTAIVDMYSKCGNIESALDVFYGVVEKSKTVFLFNSVISGLAQHGLGKKAMAVYREMKSLGLRPDGVTFVGLLCACSHGGLVEEGKNLFDSMVEEHGIEPQIEHYGCMVDLLGRGGFLKDAYDFIERMPIEANLVIWGALLSACRIHENIEMGEIAGKRLLELDPDHAGRYILLSNMLADSNRWEDAQRVRKQMEERGISKPAGLSYVELNGSLHHFSASDGSWRQDKKMDLMLEEMAKRLRSVGYVPNTRRVSFDIDEEEKEDVVSYHSEKLALAFGLMNLGPAITIRIVKNLRICGDCHTSFKLVSEIFRREIVVRDRIRFHHFKNGLCSCMDYW
ncbi:pentatricopeptide repeat-containing protein At3g62890-like isoform X2 [Tasmannia lanceolata]|uniref:pentatricopeptide repeat-containing protein At3g62890-like isoform X2 n=1 Tax=Tasmannia lanceolata TaxID=3420 RepID=UPI004062E8BA